MSNLEVIHKTVTSIEMRFTTAVSRVTSCVVKHLHLGRLSSKNLLVTFSKAHSAFSVLSTPTAEPEHKPAIHRFHWATR